MLEIRVTRDGAIGRVFRFTMRRNKTPIRTTFLRR